MLALSPLAILASCGAVVVALKAANAVCWAWKNRKGGR